MTVREQAQLLGPQRSLVGVFTEPAHAAAGDRPAVVLLNSGIVHRVGANRMSVPLARALAEAGHVVLRFDLSGIGDSPPRADAPTTLDAALADVRDVLDGLERSRGIRRVILGGLCSGADHTVVYAPSDPRVVGAILLDPTLPSTALSRLHHYRRKLLSRESWANVVRGKNPLWRALTARVRRGSGAASPERSVDSPEARAFLGQAYGGTVDAGVRVLAVSTGERATYARQLVHAFPQARLGERVRLEYLEHSDHMFSLEADRARIIELIVGWASGLEALVRRDACPPPAEAAR